MENQLIKIKNSLLAAEAFLCDDIDVIRDVVMREYAEDTLTEVRQGIKVVENMISESGLKTEEKEMNKERRMSLTEIQGKLKEIKEKAV